MKKRYILPLLILSSQVEADIFSEGKSSGELRMFYLDRDRHGSIGQTQKDTNGLSVGGHLKFETSSYNGLQSGFAIYTTSSLDSTKPHRDPSMAGEDKEGYSILGEAYLQYTSGSGNFYKFGRQKLDTPLAGSDDARMLPNLFEAYLFQTPHVPDSTVTLAHVTKFAAGTFSNVYWGREDILNSNTKKMITLSSGYGINNTSGRFMDMGEYAVNENTDGVTVLGVKNSSVPNTTLQLWNYYAHDILNALYLQADYKTEVNNFGFNTAFQYINESSMGDELGGEIESNYYGFKIGSSIQNYSLSFAGSQTGSSDDKTGAIISPWGGMPAFTQGMVTRHQFFEDTQAMKVVGSYKFLEKSSIALYYASFEVGEDNGVYPDTDWTTKEFGFDLKYYPADNLLLRFRGNYPTDFIEGLNWDETRVIVSYKF
jgi:hypothetical protein